MCVIEGKIIYVLDDELIQSKNGNSYVKGHYVLETSENYPKKIHFTIFGQDKIDDMNIQVGENVSLSVDITSREFNGKWYTDVQAFRRNNANDVKPQQEETHVDNVNSGGNSDNRLPF